MELDTKFVFFSIIFIILLSGAELRLSKRFAFFNVTDFVFHHLFPKEPNILRIRNSEEAKTINKVTTLDFVSVTKYFFNSRVLLALHFRKIVSAIGKN